MYIIKEKEINGTIQYKLADFMVVLQELLPSKRINNSCVNQSQVSKIRLDSRLSKSQKTEQA